jgi:D-threo-aldose 1-dehydrogenase
LRPIFDYSYDGIMRTFEGSLRRLNLPYVDILNIHDPDHHWEEAISIAYPAIHRLRNEGVVRAIGVGMNQAGMLARFAREGDFDCLLLAGRYTLIDQSGLDELLPICERRGISVIVGGPYNSGILATGARSGATYNYDDAEPAVLEKVAAIEAVCDRNHSRGTFHCRGGAKLPLVHAAHSRRLLAGASAAGSLAGRCSRAGCA